MKKQILIYLTCCGAQLFAQTESFLAKVWQIEKPEVAQPTSIEKTPTDLKKAQLRTARLNKDIQFPLVIKNQLKGTITFKQGREVVIVNERSDVMLIAIGTFSGEIKKDHITLN